MSSSSSAGKPKFFSPDGRYQRDDEKLGSGAYKDVWVSYDTETGKQVAWNSVDMKRLPPAEVRRIRGETEILKELSHPSIIQFFDVWENKDLEQICFTTEIVTGGTLKQFINRVKGGIKLKVIKKWCRQILHGLSYLHSHDPPIIHRDLKCDNIFIHGSTGEIRIGDFGLSSFIRKSHAESVLGTPEFMAPELYEENYTEKVDIYAFGMCVLEMASKEYPYQECTNPAQIWKKVSRGEKPEVIQRIQNLRVRKFIEICLVDQDCRLSAADLLKHPFLYFKRCSPMTDNAIVICDPRPVKEDKEALRQASKEKEEKEREEKRKAQAESEKKLDKSHERTGIAAGLRESNLYDPISMVRHESMLKSPPQINSSLDKDGKATNTPHASPNANTQMNNSRPAAQGHAQHPAQSSSAQPSRQSAFSPPMPHHPMNPSTSPHDQQGQDLFSHDGQGHRLSPNPHHGVVDLLSHSNPQPATPHQHNANLHLSASSQISHIEVEIEDSDLVASALIVIHVQLPHKKKKQIKFEFDYRNDTSVNIATEMVKALSLEGEDVQNKIAVAIEEKIAAPRKQYMDTLFHSSKGGQALALAQQQSQQAQVPRVFNELMEQNLSALASAAGSAAGSGANSAQATQRDYPNPSHHDPFADLMPLVHSSHQTSGAATPNPHNISSESTKSTSNPAIPPLPPVRSSAGTPIDSGRPAINRPVSYPVAVADAAASALLHGLGGVHINSSTSHSTNTSPGNSARGPGHGQPYAQGQPIGITIVAPHVKNHDKRATAPPGSILSMAQAQQAAAAAGHVKSTPAVHLASATPPQLSHSVPHIQTATPNSGVPPPTHVFDFFSPVSAASGSTASSPATQPIIHSSASSAHLHSSASVTSLPASAAAIPQRGSPSPGPLNRDSSTSSTLTTNSNGNSGSPPRRNRISDDIAVNTSSPAGPRGSVPNAMDPLQSPSRLAHVRRSSSADLRAALAAEREREREREAQKMSELTQNYCGLSIADLKTLIGKLPKGTDMMKGLIEKKEYIELLVQLKMEDEKLKKAASAAAAAASNNHSHTASTGGMPSVSASPASVSNTAPASLFGNSKTSSRDGKSNSSSSIASTASTVSSVASPSSSSSSSSASSVGSTTPKPNLNFHPDELDMFSDEQLRLVLTELANHPATKGQAQPRRADQKAPDRGEIIEKIKGMKLTIRLYEDQLKQPKHAPTPVIANRTTPPSSIPPTPNPNIVAAPANQAPTPSHSHHHSSVIGTLDQPRFNSNATRTSHSQSTPPPVDPKILADYQRDSSGMAIGGTMGVGIGIGQQPHQYHHQHTISSSTTALPQPSAIGHSKPPSISVSIGSPRDNQSSPNTASKKTTSTSSTSAASGVDLFSELLTPHHQSTPAPSPTPPAALPTITIDGVAAGHSATATMPLSVMNKQSPLRVSASESQLPSAFSLHPASSGGPAHVHAAGASTMQPPLEFDPLNKKTPPTSTANLKLFDEQQKAAIDSKKSTPIGLRPASPLPNATLSISPLLSNKPAPVQVAMDSHDNITVEGMHGNQSAGRRGSASKPDGSPYASSMTDFSWMVGKDGKSALANNGATNGLEDLDLPAAALPVLPGRERSGSHGRSASLFTGGNGNGNGTPLHHEEALKAFDPLFAEEKQGFGRSRSNSRTLPAPAHQPRASIAAITATAPGPLAIHTPANSGPAILTSSTVPHSGASTPAAIPRPHPVTLPSASASASISSSNSAVSLHSLGGRSPAPGP